MWVSIAQAFIYTNVINYVELNKNDENSKIKYGNVSVVLVCIVKCFKFVNDTLMFYFFFRFLIFFLNFRSD